MIKQKEKLENIARIWNHYIWEYKFCQSQINFDEEIKTNYFGDILAYFQDTLELINNKPQKGSYQENVFYAIGLLQTVYVQQDLIKELLYIFKLDSDKLTNEDNRNINRNLRNELIGHPMRRAVGSGEELISSVIFGNNLDNDSIHYVIYPKTNNYKGEEKYHNVNDIIVRHEEFLLKNLEEVEKKCFEILNYFLKKIEELNTLIEKEIPFEGLLRVARNQFEYVYKLNYLFVEEYLIEMNNKRSIQKRYEFGVNLFYNELKEVIKNTRADICETIGKGQRTLNVTVAEDPIENNNNYNYELGKLHGKHPIFNPEYFKRLFADDVEICAELENMIENNQSDLEYYCSYEYVRYLIKSKSSTPTQ